MTQFKIVSNKVEGGTTPAMLQIATEKLGFIETSEDIRITVEPFNNHVRTSLSFVDNMNHHYRLKTEGETFYACVDELKDMAKRAIRKFHEKTREKSSYKELSEDDDLAITKEKVIITSELSVSDAICEMNELGHDWYLFRSDETGEPSLVYRRFDGNYGLVTIK